MKKVFFIGVIFSFLFLTSCISGNSKSNTEDLQMYKRNDFETIFYGKPEEYVIERLGEPNQVQGLYAIGKIWYHYSNITYSDVMGN